MLIMLDSTNPQGMVGIPSDVVAAYVDHDGVNTYEQLPALFPGKRHVSITNLGNPADVIDVEHAGNSSSASIPTALTWVQQMRKAGRDPIVYSDVSTWPSIVSAFNAAKISLPRWWAADYDGDSTSIPSGAIGKQYEANTVNPHTQALYDTSVIDEALWFPVEEVDVTPEQNTMLVNAQNNSANALTATNHLRDQMQAFQTDVDAKFAALQASIVKSGS